MGLHFISKRVTTALNKGVEIHTRIRSAWGLALWDESLHAICKWQRKLGIELPGGWSFWVSRSRWRPERLTIEEPETLTERLQYERGAADARAGHAPAITAKSYLEGYTSGVIPRAREFQGA